MPSASPSLTKFRMRPLRFDLDEAAAAAARSSVRSVRLPASAPLAPGDLIDIRSRARSAGVAPKAATRKRTSEAAFISPRHIAACSKAVSAKSPNPYP